MTGDVFHRTQEYAARQRGESFERYTYATVFTVEFPPLPCWRHLTPEQRKIRIAGLLRDIQAEATAERKATGKELPRSRRSPGRSVSEAGEAAAPVRVSHQTEP